MRFTLEIEVDAKRNTSKILSRVIERAADGVMKERQVKTCDVRGAVVADPEESK